MNKKPLIKDDVIKNKKEAIKSLNSLLEYYINSDNPKHLKKANLISYWIKNFNNYIHDEELYNPLLQQSYNRGDVVKINFGFNVGKEYGGLHYAIVLDKDNTHSSHVITVVPLTSGVETDAYYRDVYLGTELFSKLMNKHTLMLNHSKAELDEYQKLTADVEIAATLVNETIEKSTVSANDDSDFLVQFQNLVDLKQARNDKIAELERDILFLDKSQNEILKLKHGSIALIEQITTVDKARIYTPRKSTDVLHGIRFSDEKMDSINSAIKKLYIY